MKNLKKYYSLFIIIIMLIITSCKEEISIESIADSESAIVVQATITNEFKYHEVNISSTSGLNSNQIHRISNAYVRIVAEDQLAHSFHEKSPGKYISDNEFSAQPNIKYSLHIETSDGNTYVSKPTELTNITQIDQLVVSREKNSLGTEGMAISVNSFDPSGNSKYYKYEYEETYKIIAPNWSLSDMIVSENEPYGVEKIPKTEEKKICYNTDKSINIIQYETTRLAEDNVNFKVRFISSKNPIISHRYSILVKQYVQSLEAYTYYKTLNEISGSDNVFSQNQPGFIAGNINSTLDSSKKVIGFFEVSSVSSKRIYFNYSDFFMNESLPPYFIDCIKTTPSIKVSLLGGPTALVRTVQKGEQIYYGSNGYFPDPIDDNVGPYYFVPRACGDCTAIGSNEVPEFWEE